MIKNKMLVRLAICWLIIGFLISCSSAHEEIVTKDDNGNPVSSYTIRKEDGVKDGTYKVFIDGIIAEEGVFKDGKQDGIRTLFYESKAKQVEETYDNGKLTAKKTYFEDGTLQSEGTYDDKVTMSGEWKYYYENGQLKESVNFKNNVEDGNFTEYHENGKIKTEGTYVPVSFGIEVEGLEDGELRQYDENGELVMKKQCNSGRCETIWTAEEGDINE